MTKPAYMYALIDPNGVCWRIDDNATTKIGLNALLADGWRPLRETPFRDTNLILLLFERDSDSSSFGFGFNPG